MDDKTSARQKDEILKYLIEEYILDKGTAFGTKELVRVIFKNVINEQKVTDLCEEIITEDSDLLYKVTNFSSAKYRATDKTSEFLSNHGGFTSRNKEKEDKELDEKSKEGERRELQDPRIEDQDPLGSNWNIYCFIVTGDFQACQGGL